jgi:hypothetical protein
MPICTSGTPFEIADRPFTTLEQLPEMLVISRCTASMLLLALVGACNRGGDASPSKPPAGTEGNDPSSIVVHITGDRSATIQANADQGSVAAMPSRTGKTLITINAARVEQNEDNHTDLVIGPFPAPSLNELTQHGGSVTEATATVKFAHGEREATFTNDFYAQFFDTSATAANSRAETVFTKVTKLGVSNGLARYRLVGRFRFNAADHPEPLSKACNDDAVGYAATHGERHPHLNGKLCGATKISVDGSFDTEIQVLQR